MNVDPVEQSINEERRTQVVDRVLSGMEVQKKELVKKFLAALYPGRPMLAVHVVVHGESMCAEPSIHGTKCRRGGLSAGHMPSHYLLVTADRGKRPVVETNMDAELSGEEAGEMVVLAEDDYGLAMRRMFGEESGGGIRMRDSALGAASYSTASGGLGIQPGIVQSDEAFATYLQALLDENDACSI